jgi:lipoprotein-anchoring transpeptidase ErfK/SrfK
VGRTVDTRISTNNAISGSSNGISRPGRRLARAGRCGGSAAAASGLLLIAACQGGSAAARSAAVYPLAKVTITTGNLRFTSTTGGGRTLIAAEQAAGGRGGVARPAADVPVDERPDLGVRVTARPGVLASVSVTNAAGQRVDGSFISGATGWRTAWALAPAQTYRVTATAVNPGGKRTVTTGTFRTLAPAHTFSASVGLTAGQTVGVGMPIMVTFSQPIKDKAAVERSFDIYASKPVVGAWYWMSSDTLWFRPEDYWPAHTAVSVTAHLSGVQAAPGVYGSEDVSQHFTIGDSLIAVASAATHYMKIWWNGRLEGNWAISTGQVGDDTPDGQYLSFAMANPVDMDSASYGVMPGDPGYYNIWVYDSVQFTFSGDYVHSAPWSVGEQGFANVSHGCVNVAPGNAAWYYDHSVLGDPIKVVGSPEAGTWGNGWTIWFLSWRTLLAGSATGDAVVADSLGSRFVPASAFTPGSRPSGQRLVSALQLPCRLPKLRMSV